MISTLSPHLIVFQSSNCHPNLLCSSHIRTQKMSFTKIIAITVFFLVGTSVAMPFKGISSHSTCSCPCTKETEEGANNQCGPNSDCCEVLKVGDDYTCCHVNNVGGEDDSHSGRILNTKADVKAVDNMPKSEKASTVCGSYSCLYRCGYFFCVRPCITC